MNCSHMLEYLKQGRRMVNADWPSRGDGMFIVLQRGYPEGIPINANTAQAIGIPEKTICRFRPYIMQKTKRGDYGPWNPTTDDLLSNRWEFYNEDEETEL